MRKIQKHIEIVRSTTADLNSLGRKSCDAIQEVLARHYASVGVTIVNDLNDLERMVAKKPDLAFMGMKYLPIKDPEGILDTHRLWISAYLEDHGIRYTGSDQKAGEFELNKPSAKQRVLEAGLSSSAFFVVKNGQTFADEDLTLQFPLFVKPASLGSGKGIDSQSIVHDIFELRAKITALSAKYSTDVLVEEFLPGREFSVALLQAEHTEELAIMPIELVGENNVPEGRILSEEEKSSNQSTVLPVTDPVLREQIITMARGTFKALGAQDYGRIDIRLDQAGVPHFLEANLIPSLIRGYGSFPIACALNTGMDHETMLLRIVNLALAHPLPSYELEARAASAVSFRPIVAL